MEQRNKLTSTHQSTDSALPFRSSPHEWMDGGRGGAGRCSAFCKRADCCCRVVSCCVALRCSLRFVVGIIGMDGWMRPIFSFPLSLTQADGHSLYLPIVFIHPPAFTSHAWHAAIVFCGCVVVVVVVYLVCVALWMDVCMDEADAYIGGCQHARILVHCMYLCAFIAFPSSFTRPIPMCVCIVQAGSCVGEVSVYEDGMDQIACVVMCRASHRGRQAFKQAGRLENGKAGRLVGLKGAVGMSFHSFIRPFVRRSGDYTHNTTPHTNTHISGVHCVLIRAYHPSILPFIPPPMVCCV